MANKTREEVETQEQNKERHNVRLNFWKEYLKEMNKVSTLYQNVSPSKDAWIGCGSGMSSVGYNSVATRNYVRIELYINSGDKENNKAIFDALASKKDKIEAEFGEPLTWERLDNNVTARVKFELSNVSIFNEQDWTKMIAFLVPHKESKQPLYTFVVPVDSIEKMTKVDFFPQLENKLENQLEKNKDYKDWSFN
jgi:hypothetical protein